MAPPGMEDMTSQLQGMFSNFAKDKKTTKKLSIKEAIKKIFEMKRQINLSTKMILN